MVALATLLGLLAFAAVVWLISAPLRAQAAGRQTPAQERDEQRRIDLEIERDQKYAEIRELEMDLRTGKLSEGDYRITDRQLRAEAVDILHELDRLGVPSEEQPARPAGDGITPGDEPGRPTSADGTPPAQEPDGDVKRAS